MNRNRRVLMTFLGMLCLRAFGADTALFDQANQYYEQGRYPEAIQGYETLLARHPSVAVHFNLGNAWFKSGRLGEAVAHYLEAKRLSPRDPDVLANLRFARDRVAGPSYQPGWLQRKIATLTLREWAAVATTAVWVFFGLLTARILRPAWRPALRGWTFVAAMLAAVLVTAAIWASRLAASGRIAVVTQPDVILHLGPFEESQHAATLKDGAELRILDGKEDWLQVTADGRQVGWVSSAEVRQIKP